MRVPRLSTRTFHANPSPALRKASRTSGRSMWRSSGASIRICRTASTARSPLLRRGQHDGQGGDRPIRVLSHQSRLLLEQFAHFLGLGVLELALLDKRAEDDGRSTVKDARVDDGRRNHAQHGGQQAAAFIPLLRHRCRRFRAGDVRAAYQAWAGRTPRSRPGHRQNGKSVRSACRAPRGRCPTRS